MFGSAQYASALAEVRQFSDNLTAAQLLLAQDWAPRPGAYMNGVAADLVLKYKLTDRDAARAFALANMAAIDVLNACFDAKFAYYYIRPSQADPLIKLPIGLSNHPSYPSGHSCITEAYANVLAILFPNEELPLQAAIEEAGSSRMYAGLHYRFDCTAGRDLGRHVAQQVIGVWRTSKAAYASH